MGYGTLVLAPRLLSGQDPELLVHDYAEIDAEKMGGEMWRRWGGDGETFGGERKSRQEKETPEMESLLDRRGGIR